MSGRNNVVKLSDSDRDGLTDAEIEALESDLTADDDNENDDDDFSSYNGGEDDNLDDEDDDELEEDEKDEEEEADPDEEDNNSDDDTDDLDDEDADGDDDTDEAVEATPDDIRAPKRNAPDVESLEATLKTTQEERKAIRDKWNEGFIDDDDYHDQLDELMDKISDIKDDIREAKNAEEMTMERWQIAQEAFFEQPDNRVFQQNDMLFGLLNNEVGKLTSADDFDGNYTKVLRRATVNVRKAVKELTGSDIAKADGKKDPGESDADKRLRAREERKNRNKDRARKTKSLRGLPSADDSKTDGEFAHLDRLKGRDLELALSRLSEAQQNAWYQEDVDY